MLPKGIHCVEDVAPVPRVVSLGAHGLQYPCLVASW